MISASVAHSLSYPEGPPRAIELYPTLPQYREVGATVRSTVGHQDLSLCLHHACRFAGHLAGTQILISRFGLSPEILLPGKVLVHRPHFQDQGFRSHSINRGCAAIRSQVCEAAFILSFIHSFVHSTNACLLCFCCCVLNEHN